MKKFLSVICCLAIILSLAACGGGGGDALKGTWEQEGTDYGTVTWKFDGKGGFTSESDFFDNKGTYSLLCSDPPNVRLRVCECCLHRWRASLP